MSEPESSTTRDTLSTTVDEELLVAGLRRGDEEAYAEVVREYGGRLLALARRLLRNEDDARDALQEAFLAAFRKIDQFQGNAKLSTWLHRIVVNASLMRRRKISGNREVSMNTVLPQFSEGGHLLEPPTPWEQSAEALLSRKETRAYIRDSIDQLSEKYRTVLLLRDIEGKSTAETAEILDLEQATVKTRLHRARQALRNLLDDHLRDVA